MKKLIILMGLLFMVAPMNDLGDGDNILWGT